MPHRGFKAAVPRAVPKGVEAELVEKRRHGDVRVLRHRVAQRERPVRGQLDQQPLGQRRDGVVLVFRRQGFAADGDDGDDARRARPGWNSSAPSASAWSPDAAFGIASGRLVLGPDIAAIDAKAAVFIDADERAGACDVGRLEPDRAILEFHERGLDLAHPLIHLVRQFVGVGVLGFEPVMFRVQGVDGRLFLSCEIERRAIQSAQVMVMAVGKIDRRLHPLPAFGGDRLGLGLQLLGHQAVEQADRFQPAAVILREEVARDHASGRFISVEADENRTPVAGPDRALRQHAADLVGVLRPGFLDRVPDLFLTGVVGRHREGHELLQRHAVLGIDGEELWRHGRKPQALLDDVDRNEEGGGDILVRLPFLAQGLEGAELIERMKRDALDVLGQGVVFGEDARRRVAHHARYERGLGEALLLHQQRQRLIAPSAGRNLEHAGLGALGVENRPDIQALQKGAPGDILGELLDRDSRP